MARRVHTLRTVDFLITCWGLTPGLWRLVITLLLLNVAVINAVGVYSRLVADHLGDTGARATTYAARDAGEGAKVEVAAARLADLDRRIALIDSAAEGVPSRSERLPTDVVVVPTQLLPGHDFGIVRDYPHTDSIGEPFVATTHAASV